MQGQSCYDIVLMGTLLIYLLYRGCYRTIKNNNKLIIKDKNDKKILNVNQLNGIIKNVMARFR